MENILFLSTPSARRATGDQNAAKAAQRISIHALCEEGDVKPYLHDNDGGYFYPRPLRGGRLGQDVVSSIRTEFLSTPSARRATTDEATQRLLDKFLSTPSARRATFTVSYSFSGRSRFLSTPSARRATPRRTAMCVLMWNFYPRPLRGGRHSDQLHTSHLQ